jgi:hypothetical protein
VSTKEICVAGTPNADTRACYDLTDESGIPAKLEEGAKVSVTVELEEGRRPDDVISVVVRD